MARENNLSWGKKHHYEYRYSTITVGKKKWTYNYIAVLYMCYVNHPLISIWNPQIHPELRL